MRGNNFELIRQRIEDRAIETADIRSRPDSYHRDPEATAAGQDASAPTFTTVGDRVWHGQPEVARALGLR